MTFLYIMNQDNAYTYLDYAASTPVDDRVLQAMLPFFSETFGNSSSIHRQGQQAEAAIEQARVRMAQGLNCLPGEIIFTSCGSESDNLALRGAALATRQTRQANHILTARVEHHAVSHTAVQLGELFGFEVEFLPVNEFGQVQVESVAARLRPDTALVSVMYANNEIGTINPISKIGALCRKNGVIFHTDAVQATAYLLVDVENLNVDLLSLGAHKFYGPKGVGALYIRRGTPMYPAQTGGGQEFGLRAGTHNTPYIIGMAKAFELAQIEREKRVNHLQPLRDRVIGRVLEEISESRLTGHPSQRLPNHASFVFQGVDGNALLMALDIRGFACSSGSACKTGSPEPSDVLTTLGLSREWALGSLRVTLGESSTAEKIDHFLDNLVEVVRSLRG